MADTPIDADPVAALKERDEIKAKLAGITSELSKLVVSKDKAVKNERKLRGELNTAKAHVKTLERKLKEVDAEERLNERDNLKKQCAAAQSAAEKAKKEASGKDTLITEKERTVQKLQRQVETLGNTMAAMQVGRDAAVKREAEALNRETEARAYIEKLEKQIIKMKEEATEAKKAEKPQPAKA